MDELIEQVAEAISELAIRYYSDDPAVDLEDLARAALGVIAAHPKFELVELSDLLDRLERADKLLLGLAGDANRSQEKWRLEAKAEGVRLAASYVREALRDG